MIKKSLQLISKIRGNRVPVGWLIWANSKRFLDQSQSEAKAYSEVL